MLPIWMPVELLYKIRKRYGYCSEVVTHTIRCNATFGRLGALGDES